MDMNFKTAVVILLISALSRVAFARDEGGGRFCAACAQKLAGGIILLESAGVKVPEAPSPPAV